MKKVLTIAVSCAKLTGEKRLVLANRLRMGVLQMMPLMLANVGEDNIIKKIGGKPDVKKHLENHKAYVKSWREYITNDPSVVEKALYQAQLATDYLDANGGVISIEEFNRLHKKDRLELYENDGKINVYHISNEKDLSEQTVSSLDWLNEEKEEEHQSFSRQRM